MTPAPALTKWKWCLATSLAIAVLTLIPQIHLWLVRGHEWKGAYISAFVDEPYYGAYVNALIDSRPRRNDPFGAKNDSPQDPLPESLYSIQFLPAYAIALPARWLGISASTAFIISTPITAFLAGLSVFATLILVTNDHRLAASGVFFVLCLGGFFGSYGIFHQPVDIAFPALPFTRRYEPSIAFPLYILFSALVWATFKSQNRRVLTMRITLAGLAVAALVFSYFYLWTAALAWLVCFGVLWCWFRPSEKGRALVALAGTLLLSGLALLPYAILISRRGAATDEQQIMVLTRRPELFHSHEIIAVIMLAVLAFGIMRKRVVRSDPRFIFAVSTSLLPFVVFNQQLVTGRTLQAFHFEIYSVNYSIAIGILIIVNLFWNAIFQRVLVWAGAVSLMWGFIAVALPARAVGIDLATADDNRIPVLRRLRHLANQDNTIADLRTRGDAATLVYSPSIRLIALLPSWTPQGTLLDISGGDCAGVTREERKSYLFTHLYYSTVGVDDLRQALIAAFPPPPESLASARNVIFGHARLFPGLSSRFVPIQPREIEEQAQSYERFLNSFSHDQAAKRPVAYAVVPVKENFNFANIDRWYERDSGEVVGDYTLYRLRLRP